MSQSLSKSLISILMPVKNAGPFLKECLDSILAQTETNWELIAINDHSTDDSNQILKHYSNKDFRIKVFENKGRGIIHALRLAYAKCEGNLITRMDADDLMPAKKLATLKNMLIDQGIGYLATGKVRYFSSTEVGGGYQRYESWLNQLMDAGDPFREIYKECVIPSPCWMIWRKDFERCGAFQPETYPEDYDLCFRFYAAGLKVTSSEDILHLWRDSQNRASRILPEYADNRFLSLKINWFLKLEVNEDIPIVVWGAGSKGKWIANYLINENIPFLWVTNNQKKIGVNINGIILKDFEALKTMSGFNAIVAVANMDDQKEILFFLEKNFLNQSARVFFFC
ncbi:MAG: glycosyltransferase family 2 protein [Bacteroidota bacterium]